MNVLTINEYTNNTLNCADRKYINTFKKIASINLQTELIPKKITDKTAFAFPPNTSNYCHYKEELHGKIR